MTKLDLVEKAINFAMNDLCGSHLDMPCGCDGCPYGNVRRDDDGNPDCRGFVLDEFINKYHDEFKEKKENESYVVPADGWKNGTRDH